MGKLAKTASLVLGVLGLAALATAQEVPPDLWDRKEQLPVTKADTISRLRFLTTVDFPPFNFFDRNGRLTGFHVDLVEAICRELDISAKCQIQAMPWDELGPAIETRRGDAVIAGLSVTEQTREKYEFTRPYFLFPARLLVSTKSEIAKPLTSGTAEKRIGVMSGSAHERMLRSYFPNAKAVVFSRESWMHDALLSGDIDGILGDGMRLSFWLSGSGSKDCCAFAGGAYYAPGLLGNGLAIAVPKGNTRLTTALNQALREIESKGIISELYLRYFPIAFY